MIASITMTANNSIKVKTHMLPTFYYIDYNIFIFHYLNLFLIILVYMIKNANEKLKAPNTSVKK